MLRYISRRAVQALVVLVLVSLIVFAMLHALPGGPARAVIGPQGTDLQVAQFSKENGLDRPLPIQYLDWVSGLVRGDFGYSYKLNQSVSSLFAQTIPKTVLLIGTSTLLAVALALVLGVVQAARRNSVLDHVITVLSLLGYATPVFFVAMMLVLVFSIKLGWFPAQAPQSDSIREILEYSRALVLPIVAFAIGIIAIFTQFVRSSMIDSMLEEYVRTARAKGASERRILVRHLPRNSLGPVVTLLGLFLPVILSGSIVIESVFNYPGLGLLFWNAARVRDFPILLSTAMVVALVTVIGSLLADIVNAWLNPTIREI